MNPTITIRIIRPSSREQTDLLPARIDELRQSGFEILYDDLPRDPTWPYVASPTRMRADALAAALLESGTDAVWCARGGYGASDLLPLLPWAQLAQATAKPVIGFSDASALHSALATKLGWPCLHAPMPATALWRNEDGGILATILMALKTGEEAHYSLPLEAVSRTSSAIDGELFGGCFTVLTNLIGTPYLPPTLKGRIVFIEDTDEHPARLMRAFNQWLQSGRLDGAKALVVGHLRNLGDKIDDAAAFVYERFAERSPIPVFKTKAFGHTAPNFPLMLGARAQIAANGSSLTWRYSAP